MRNVTQSQVQPCETKWNLFSLNLLVKHLQGLAEQLIQSMSHEMYVYYF